MWYLCTILSLITLFCYCHAFYSNVKPILDALCSGRQSCSTEMRDFWDLTELWALTSSCPKELDNYLQARFICVPGEWCAVDSSYSTIFAQQNSTHLEYLFWYTKLHNVTFDTFLFQSFFLVVTPGPYCCQLTSSSVDIHAGVGTLASSVTATTGCGVLTCPWVLKAVDGQQINISLIDFRYGKFNCLGFPTLK